MAAANSRGAGLTLGSSLPTARDEIELYRLEFTAGGTSAADTAIAGGSGTLVVTAGDDDALAEYQRCESSGELICFRAANVALYFADADPAELTRLAAAITAMGQG